MYTREDKLRAVELFIKYGFSPQSVINELGYPYRGSLYNRYREYAANGNDIPDASPYERYSESLKRVAVDHYFEHGRCLPRTCRMLGYPSKEILAAWIDDLEPDFESILGCVHSLDFQRIEKPNSCWIFDR